MISGGLKRWFALGSGAGVSIEGSRGAESLRITAVRVRPTGARVAGGFVIEDFQNQPAAEWGSTYSAFLSKLGMKHVSAVVMLPRQDVILRLLSLPGVSGKDLDSAVAFQMDGLHPYEDVDVISSYARLDDTGTVLVAIARRDVVARYASLFAEAGIKLAGFTCSGPAIFSALRLFGAQPSSPLLAAEPSPAGGIEIYGESPARALFSARFDDNTDRAVSLASAELRIETAPTPIPLNELLKADSPLAYASALSSACRRLSLPLNLLPADQRQIESPMRWALPAGLGAVALLLAIALVAFPNFENGRYLRSLEAEIAKVQPSATRAAEIDKAVEAARSRTSMLDSLRLKSKADMDVLAELTRLLPPPTWVNSLQIDERQIQIAGETPQASPLLKTLDESELFESSEFSTPPSRVEGGESFRIRIRRAGGIQ